MAKLLLLSLLVVAMVLSLSDQGDARCPFGRYRRPFGAYRRPLGRSPWNPWYGGESDSFERWDSYDSSYSFDSSGSFDDGYYKR